MDMSGWEGKFLQVTKSSYTRCGSSSVVRQSLVVPTSDGSVLVEDLPPQTPIPRPPDLAPLAPLSGPRRRHFPLQKKADMSKSLGVETRIWVKKHNFWGRWQELVRLTSFGLFCRYSGEYRKVKKGREGTRKILRERGRGEKILFLLKFLIDSQLAAKVSSILLHPHAYK